MTTTDKLLTMYKLVTKYEIDTMKRYTHAVMSGAEKDVRNEYSLKADLYKDLLEKFDKILDDAFLEPDKRYDI